MLTCLVLVVAAGFAVYKLGSAAAKHPEAAAEVGKAVCGLLRK